MPLRPYGSWDFDIGSCSQHGFFALLRWVHPWIGFGNCLNNFWIIWNVNKNESIFCLKMKLPNLNWIFYITWIKILLMKHKLINFDWIVDNLIVLNLLINHLNQYWRVHTEVAARRCSVAVIKNHKQPLADVLRNRCS